VIFSKRKFRTDSSTKWQGGYICKICSQHFIKYYDYCTETNLGVVRVKDKKVIPTTFRLGVLDAKVEHFGRVMDILAIISCHSVTRLLIWILWLRSNTHGFLSSVYHLISSTQNASVAMFKTQLLLPSAKRFLSIFFSRAHTYYGLCRAVFKELTYYLYCTIIINSAVPCPHPFWFCRIWLPVPCPPSNFGQSRWFPKLNLILPNNSTAGKRHAHNLKRFAICTYAKGYKNKSVEYHNNLEIL